MASSFDSCADVEYFSVASVVRLKRNDKSTTAFAVKLMCGEVLLQHTIFNQEEEDGNGAVDRRDEGEVASCCDEEEANHRQLGVLNRFDEIEVLFTAVRCASDEASAGTDSSDNGESVLEQVSIPILCLKATQPAVLTLEDHGVQLVTEFTVFPVDVTDYAVPEYSYSSPVSFATPSSAGAISRSTTIYSMVDAKGSGKHFPASPPQHIPAPCTDTMATARQGSLSYSSNCSTPTGRWVPDEELQPPKLRTSSALSSKAYSFIRGMLIAILHSPLTLEQSLRTLRAVVYYSVEGSKFMLLVVMDVAKELIRLLDLIIQESCKFVDSGIDTSTHLLASGIHSLSQQLEKFLDGADQALTKKIRYALLRLAPLMLRTIRIAHPYLEVALRVTKPAMSTAEPLLRPLISLAMEMHGRLQSTVLVGPVVVHTTKHAQEIVQYAQQIYYAIEAEKEAELMQPLRSSDSQSMMQTSHQLR